MKYLISLLFFSCQLINAFSQGSIISGKVVDEEGNPIPFASIFLSDVQQGTAANNEGTFRLEIPDGPYEITASAVGYRNAKQQLRVPLDQPLVIKLSAELFTLQEVVIGNQEDPAYRIIRKAIQQRKTHLEETEAYTAQVYIKGLQRMLKAPKKFLGVNVDEIGQEMGLDSNRRGIIYLSESESKISSLPPDNFREELLSSKVSGSNRAFSFNRASDLRMNFYENNQPIMEGLSARPFVSPIADQALNHYHYKLVGTAEEDGKTVHKIQVIPKRKAAQLYQGDVYILEDEWRLQSVNLLIDKEAGLNFVDSLRIKQQFTLYEGDHWMPSTVQLDFRGGLFGFEVEGYFTAAYQDYEFPRSISKKSFREVLSIKKGVNEMDSLYWEGNRPIPLTAEERADYAQKDSLRVRRESEEYRDSLDARYNRFKPLGFLPGGYTYRHRASASFLRLNGLLPAFQFNTVEGLAVDYGVTYSKRLDSASNRWMTLKGNVRYGFINKRLNPYGSIAFPINKHQFRIEGGSNLVDLNSRGGMSPLFNTAYTLLLGENYKKWFEKAYVNAQWSHRLPGNIRLKAEAEWARRQWLPNASDFTFREQNRDKLTSNNPFQPETDRPLFDPNRSASLEITASYDFSQKYVTYPEGRYYLRSDYPTLSVSYKKGFNGILGSDVDYDLLRASLGKTDWSLGRYGRLSWTAIAGKFLNNNQLFFPDFWHFKGNQILFAEQSTDSFLGLDYYLYSTPSSFVELHGEYNLAGMLTSRVPLMRKLKLEEILGAHYLHTPELKHYAELHAGFKWQFLRVMYAHSLSSNPVLKSGHFIRIALSGF